MIITGSLHFIWIGLWQRINENNEFPLQIMGGTVEKAKFEFSAPAGKEDVPFLSEKYKLLLAQYYVDFLLFHNGAKLFDIGFGEYTEIYSINPRYCSTFITYCTLSFMPGIS
ncbi:hypothetical protein [Paenibacillus macerans]|uniref:hypothetical protein n=1 Tax=Paenibacillus macerans TaxID=44252 RepID=UPI003D3241E3